MSVLNKRRLVMLGLAAGLAAWVAFSFHSVATGEIVVRDAPLVGLRPSVLAPGWCFAPPGLARLTRYPAASRKLQVDLTGEDAAASREGVKVQVEVELTYSIPPDRAVGLHGAHGPAFESGWLGPLLKEEARSRLAAVSYDVVRDRDPELTQSLRAALDGKVAALGLRLEGLRIVPVAGLGEASGEILRAGVQVEPKQVVVIGVDSFDWRLLDPLMQQGRLPNLSKLVARGARANLRTIRPILSPVIWTSIATGFKPTRHGIVDFVVSARDTGALIPVTSAMRQVPALWTLMSRQGVDVDVVAWWATWPAETVRGSVVTDRVAYQLFEESVKDDWKSTDPERNKGKTYPPELIDEIRPLIKSPADVADSEVASFLGGGRIPSSLTKDQDELLKSFRTVIAAGETYHAIAMKQLRGRGPGLKLFYYQGPDEASHLFMRFRPPLLEGVSRADMELFGPIVERYYEKQDRFIGEIVGAAGPDATIVLLSDHGFKSDSNRPPNSDPRIGKGDAADWHTAVGVLAMAGPGIRQGAEIGAASILDITPTILALYGLPVARDMDGQPLTEALTPDLAAGRQVAWIDSYGGFREAGADLEGATAGAEDPEMIEKLRSLGYIGEERLTANNNRGLMALDDGDFDMAIQEFEQALTKQDDASINMVRTNLARALLAKGDLQNARRRAEEAIRHDPRNKFAEVILGGVEMRAGDLAAAERHFRRAIEIDSTHVQAYSKLGELYAKKKDDEAALSYFRKAVEISPLNTLDYNHIGNIHRKRGELDKAIEAYREALRTDARSVGAYNNLGLCLQQKGELGEARDLYEKALLIRPESPILRNSLATVLSLQGDKQRAVEELQRAAAVDPNWPIARGNLATLLFEMGRLKEARPAFEKWVEVEPSSAEPRLGLGLCLLLLKEPQEARAQFEKALEFDPDNIRALVALGETLMRGGDLEAAQRHFERAARVDNRIARVFNNLGEIYLKKGMRQAAQQAFQRSLQLEPDQKGIRDRLATMSR